MVIDRTKFEHVYKQLLYVTYETYPDVEPSFKTGLWAKNEHYKYDVWDSARAALALDTWEAYRENPRYIYDRAVDAIDACANLLATDDSQYAQQAHETTYEKVLVTLLEDKEETAKALYGIFSTDSTEYDGKYFDILANMLKKIYDGYSYVAYFFFLKNKDQYCPVRRKANTKRLQQIGVSSSCMDPCSWENYMIYMDILKDLQKCLLEQGMETTLLDAQSFLWMLHMIDSETPEYMERTDPLESTVKSRTQTFYEGKRVEVYSTKYERDPGVRKAFLRSKRKP